VISQENYIKLLLLHIALGFGGYLFPIIIKLVLLAVIGLFMVRILYYGNRNDEVLIAASYLVGFEVFSRMTGGVGFSYEFAKYGVIVFMTLGMFYRGFHKKSWPYVLFLFLLMPGIVVSAFYVDYDVEFGNIIGFNLSGPVCLGISALYCHDRPLSQNRFNDVLTACLLPIVAMVVYLYFYTPDIRDVLTGTGSNFAASGGFGPNQVSTVIGLGMFILFTRLFLVKNRAVNFIDITLLGLLTYRAFITFSRGGVITAGVCAILFILFYLKQASAGKRKNVLAKTTLISVVFIITWIITSLLSGGLIDKRYANQDALGRVKKDVSTGRKELIETELLAFKQNPILGIGAGRTKEYRLEVTGVESATHNEISRMLSEHGLLGIIALIILLFTPAIRWLFHKDNLFLLPFLAFWFLTINHSSMRIAAPAFVYGICLISIIKKSKQ
jgi:hypothetical protein